MSRLLKEGDTATVSMIVSEEMTAAKFSKSAGEAYPEVLATPMMLGEIERACAALLVPDLAPGQMSVGAKFELSHQAPTPVGAEVKSYAKFLNKDGPLFWFEVWAEDPAGVIGRGRHARAIVNSVDVEQRAARRIVKQQEL